MMTEEGKIQERKDDVKEGRKWDTSCLLYLLASSFTQKEPNKGIC